MIKTKKKFLTFLGNCRKMKMRDEHTAKINFRRNVDMKIRNLLAALLVISLCICLPVQVSAMGAPVELTVENVSHYAYMDLDVAPAELRGTILEAREQIIFAHSWVAEGEDGLSNPMEPLKFCPNSTICSRRIGMFPVILGWQTVLYLVGMPTLPRPPRCFMARYFSTNPVTPP